MENVIIQIEENSIAEELGICAGDILLAVNGESVKDVFDYRYVMQDEYIEVLIEKPDKTQLLFEIEKDELEDLGLVFETGLLDRAKSCTNKCIFCFIDQLPQNMRETLYFKDDDSRLSFLQGNYVTLTNMKEADIDRIIFYHLSPINISVHTTDPELRKFMLKNPNAENLLAVLDKLFEAGIDMNFQIVLCKGVNDGENLDRTIEDLSRYIPKGRSLSVVPVGLTRFREKCFPLEPFTKEECAQTIRQLEKWQAIFKNEYDTAFVFAADEFYLKAGLNIPPYAHYEDFPQIENGVGMLALFEWELDKALSKAVYAGAEKTVSIATGRAAYHFMCGQAEKIMRKLPSIHLNVFAVENAFFGENITVSGLLTGIDIQKQLEGKSLGDMLLIPQNALRAGDTVFLDDVQLDSLCQTLKTDVFTVAVNGCDFLNKLLGR